MDALAKAVSAYRRGLKRSDKERADLHTAILQALASGRTQADVARTTGLTREWLRRLVKAAR